MSLNQPSIHPLKLSEGKHTQPREGGDAHRCLEDRSVLSSELPPGQGSAAISVFSNRK